MWDENGNVSSKSQKHASPIGVGHCEESKMAKLRTKAFRRKEIDPLDAAQPHETSTRNRTHIIPIPVPHGPARVTISSHVVYRPCEG